MLYYFYAPTCVNTAKYYFWRRELPVIITPSHTFTAEYSHFIWVSPPRIGLQSLLHFHGNWLICLIPCSPFPIIHLKAILQTGVIPGYYREVPMAKTSQHQISGPECSVVSQIPEATARTILPSGKWLANQCLSNNPSLLGKWSAWKSPHLCTLWLQVASLIFSNFNF